MGKRVLLNRDFYRYVEYKLRLALWKGLYELRSSNGPLTMMFLPQIAMYYK